MIFLNSTEYTLYFVKSHKGSGVKQKPKFIRELYKLCKNTAPGLFAATLQRAKEYRLADIERVKRIFYQLMQQGLYHCGLKYAYRSPGRPSLFSHSSMASFAYLNTAFDTTHWSFLLFTLGPYFLTYLVDEISNLSSYRVFLQSRKERSKISSLMELVERFAKNN